MAKVSNRAKMTGICARIALNWSRVWRRCLARASVAFAVCAAFRGGADSTV